MAKVDVDEKTLQAIAALTGGAFYRATDTDSLKQHLRADQSARENHASRATIRALPGALSLGAVSRARAARPRVWPGTHPISEAAMIFAHPLWLLGGVVGLRRTALDLAALRCAPAGGARAIRVAPHLQLAAHAVDLPRTKQCKTRAVRRVHRTAVASRWRSRKRDFAGNRSSGAATTSSLPWTLRAAC